MVNTHKKFGFTLVEIMVALGMLSMIMAALYGSYQAVTGSIDQIRPRFQAERRAVFVLNAMCRQLRACYAGRLDRTVQRRSDEVLQKLEDDPERPSAFAGKSDRSVAKLRFVTSQGRSRFAERHGELSQVIYTWDSSDGRLLTVRHPNVYQDTQDEKDLAWRCLLDSVLDLEYEFWDGQDWHSAWQEPAEMILPRAVRIRLVVGPSESDCIDLTSMVSITCRGETSERTDGDRPVKAREVSGTSNRARGQSL